MPDITVAVCTRNRVDWLKRGLDALLTQSSEGVTFEILVVDNASQDETPDAVQALMQQYPRRLRYVCEETVGLSVAKNRAISETCSPLVAFMDDDALPAKGWVKDAYEPFLNPNVMVVTGPVFGLWEMQSPPDWLAPELWCMLGLANYGDVPRWLAPNESVLGGNSAYRLSLFDRVGPFSTRLGRIGDKSLLSGEEVEFQARVRGAGFETWYNPHMALQHWVPKTRASKSYLLRRRYWEGRSIAVADALLRSKWSVLIRAFARLTLAVPRDLGGWMTSLARSEKERVTYKTRLAKHLGYVQQAVELCGRRSMK